MNDKDLSVDILEAKEELLFEAIELIRDFNDSFKSKSFFVRPSHKGVFEKLENRCSDFLIECDT